MATTSINHDAANDEVSKIRNRMAALHDTSINSESAKSRAAAVRHQRKLAWDYPEIATELGVDPGVPNISRVRRYGCLTAPVVLDTRYTKAVDRQMTLNHDLYNWLVVNSRPLRQKAIDELERGENFRAARKLHAEISGLYKEIRDINHKARKKVKSPEVDALCERIAALKKQHKELETGLSEELRAFYNGDVYKNVTGVEMNALCKAGYQKYKEIGLYYTNYNPTVVEFKTAYKATFREVKTILSGLKPRYMDRDGNAPESIGDWGAWDHAGKTRITVSNATTPRKDGPIQNPDKPIAGVMAGTNKFFKLRPLTAADLPNFPKLKVDLSKPSSKRLHIAELRVVGPDEAKGEESKGSPVFAQIVVVLHRPLPIDGTLAQAAIESRKEGFQLKHYLLVTVNFPAQAPKAKGAIAEISIAPGGNGVMGNFSRTDDTEFQTWLQAKKFDWLCSDGKLQASEFVKTATEKSEGLHFIVNEHLKQAMDRLDLLFPEKGEAKVRMPDWFYQDNFNLSGRRSIRRLYRVWRSNILESASGEPARFEQLKEAFRELRLIGRENIKSTDWTTAVKSVAYRAEAMLGIPFAQAEVFAIVNNATERFEHLYPWAVSVRDKALAKRKDEYRQFAVHFLKNVREVRLPKPKKNQNRVMTDNERNFAASLLLDAVRSVAERAGVKLHEV